MRDVNNMNTPKYIRGNGARMRNLKEKNELSMLENEKRMTKK